MTDITTHSPFVGARSASRATGTLAALALLATGISGCIAKSADQNEPEDDALGTAEQAISAKTITIVGGGPNSPVRDTSIYAQFPTYNYGTKTTIDVGKPQTYDGYNWGPDDRKQGLIWFDLSSIPAKSYIVSATLSLKVKDVLPSHGAFFGSVYAYLVTDNAWVDTSVTWTSYGQKFMPGFSKAVSPLNQGSWATVDVKDHVGLWVAGDRANFGLMLESSTVVGNVVSFSSSEDAAADRPKLEITYYTTACAPNPCKSGGKCSQNAGNYACACPAGYSGTNCEIHSDICAPNPCSAGTCVADAAAPDGYTCTCPPGRVGPKCQYNDICQSVGPYVCINGGTCNNILPPPSGGAPYTCSCNNGYSGAHCEIPPPPPYCPCGDPLQNPMVAGWKNTVKSPGVEAGPVMASTFMTKCLNQGSNGLNIDVSDSRIWLTRPSFEGAFTTFNTMAYVDRYYKNAINYCDFMSGQYAKLMSFPGVVGALDLKATNANDPSYFVELGYCMDGSNGIALPLGTPADIQGCRQQIANAPHLITKTLPDLPLPLALGAPSLLALAEMLRRRFGKKVSS